MSLVNMIDASACLEYIRFGKDLRVIDSDSFVLHLWICVVYCLSLRPLSGTITKDHTKEKVHHTTDVNLLISTRYPVNFITVEC